MRNVVVLFLLILTTPTFADTEAAWAALRAGTAVALMRHADAPGIGDPAGYRLEDCSTQRNLSERGKAQAAAVGALFRSNHIAIATIISSPWCRCLETARLMEVGPVSVDPAFSNAFVLTAQSEELKLRGSAVISAWKSGNLLVVTHGSNIAALSGLQLCARRDPGRGTWRNAAARGWSNFAAEVTHAYRGPTPVEANCCTEAAIARRSGATDGYLAAISSSFPISTSAGITPGHSVLAPRNQRRCPMRRAVWNVLPGIRSWTRCPALMSGPTMTRSVPPSACSRNTSSGSPR